jgi:hypothetical protein
MPPSASYRMEVFQMYAATRRAHRQSSGRGQNYSPDGGGAADLTPPSYLQPKRSASRPSTPKGVGRCAPLTAGSRGAKLAGRSAGRDLGVEIGEEFTGDYCGRERGPGVRSHLALQSGVGRFQFADQNRTPCLCRKHPWCLSVRLWSANRNRRVAWCGGGCERGVVRSGSGEGTGVVGGGPEKKETKRERICGGLRLVGAWWSR